MGDFLGEVGGFIGGLQGNSDRDRATQAWQSAVANYRNMNPNVDVNTQIAGDPQTQAIQNQVLQQALQRSRAGGLNAIDTARIQQEQGAQNQNAQAGQAAAMQNAQAMGTANGNSGILGALVANQGAANRANQDAMNSAAIGQQSQIASNAQAANQAGNLRGQNIGVETGNVNRAQYQANQNKQNEFEKYAGQLAGTSGLAGQDMSNAQNTANQYAAGGKMIGDMWSKFLGGGMGGMGGGGVGF